MFAVCRFAGRASLALAFILLTTTAHAQPTTAPKVDSLRTPASPAFTLLGIEPSAVERPTTPADFALTFLNKATALPALPENFAVEASPYWLVGRPQLTWRNDRARSPAASLARTFSISAATAADDDNGTNDLGVGLRASLFSGTLSKDSEDALEQAEKTLAAQGAVVQALIDRHGGAALREAFKSGAITAEQFEEQRALIEAAVFESNEYKALSKPVKDLAVTRGGFFLEFASAFTWQFSGANWENRRLHKGGVWVTPSWKGGAWDAVAVFRYVHDAIDDDTADVLEWGVRPIYSTRRFTGSVEYVRRHVVEGTGDDSYRFAGIVEHQITGDTWVTATFGRDRERDGKRAGLLAQLGLSINFSRRRFQF